LRHKETVVNGKVYVLNIRRWRRWTALVVLAAGGLGPAEALFALDPHKALTQYTRTVWNQADGLPQDTVRRITQTANGYLWLGTEEGLTRFDGYDFVTFTRNNSSLPSNSITWLTAGTDGTLWIGTAAGLVRYRGGIFTTFTTAEGLPDNAIRSILEDRDGVVWIAAGIYLSRFDNGKFTNYAAERLLPVEAVRVIYEDLQKTLWVGGVGGLLRREGDRFARVLGPEQMQGNIPIAMQGDARGNLWIGGTTGLISRSPQGALRNYDTRDGLPDSLVRALWIDRAGQVWTGTNENLSRLEKDRFVSARLAGNGNEDLIRCLFEDREGNLWIGMNSGLNRLRDGRFTMYGRTEGLPSDEPMTVRQDRHGVMWVGYHGAGLVAISHGRPKVYTTQDGLPSNGIFAIRESRDGGLLLATSKGLSRMRDGRFRNYVVPDPLARRSVYDAVEDRQGRILVATAGGVYRTAHGAFQKIVDGGPLLNDSGVVLSPDTGDGIWAGTYGKGLWHIQQETTRQYTVTDGLGSNQIRSLYLDQDGTLWIGTFGGGLNAFRNGVFSRYTARHGLLSDNISHVEDDRSGSLWLSTPRGISRIAKRQLQDLSEGQITALSPVNYGMHDGLRSAQSSPGYQVAGGGGTRTKDGRLWFTTSRGLAVIDPREDVNERVPPAPIIQFLEVSADGRKLDVDGPARLQPGTGHVQFRYTGIHLSAPERVHYAYKLQGMDRDWIPADDRRTVDYNGLRHGRYRFVVMATLPGTSSSEAFLDLEVLPYFYERPLFLWLCGIVGLAGVYGFYRLHVSQIRDRFALVLAERARMAREIHDTLAQGFVGITRQLDALGMRMKDPDRVARQHLEMAQKMARHSLTEARRSVMDLRAAALDDGDLLSALTAAARQWTPPGSRPLEIRVMGTPRRLPEDVEHNLFRISQEAVANAWKHADANKISIDVLIEPEKLNLIVKDDGRGFEPSWAFASTGGHFGLLGMRERAERVGGELHLSSQPGGGTQVAVTLPLESGAQRRRRHGVVRAAAPRRA
jgi:ligand-binding sensor domain-containing protein/two-component sensor histidine kinase